MRVDSVLEALEDGKWHELISLPEEVELPEVKTGMIVAFLANYGFVELDDEKNRVKASKAYLDFAKRIKWMERANAAGK